MQVAQPKAKQPDCLSDLKLEIEAAIEKVDALQREYRSFTGKDFVPDIRLLPLQYARKGVP